MAENGHMDDDAAAGAAGAGNTSNASGQEIDAPLVFQCARCFRIVGDSFAWVSASQELNTLTLSAAKSIHISTQMETSRKPQDLGSTYTSFSCECSAVLGRVYKTTGRHLDPIRDLLTFDLDAISSYKLGSSDTAAPVEDVLDIPTARGLQDQMLKVQNVILVMNERLQAVEAAVAEPEGAKRGHDDSAAPNPGAKSSKKSKGH
eukprot:m.160644 g.160644  ORF g.160644 m.160644 type:complete len:204 (-) comp17055_c1_seq1:482-1093(-)